MKFPVKIAFNPEDNEYLVSVDGIPEIYGSGATEAKALLDFFEQYEMVSENPKRIRNIIAKLELQVSSE